MYGRAGNSKLLNISTLSCRPFDRASANKESPTGKPKRKETELELSPNETAKQFKRLKSKSCQKKQKSLFRSWGKR